MLELSSRSLVLTTDHSERGRGLSAVSEAFDLIECWLVGAPRFELGTPSPPDCWPRIHCDSNVYPDGIDNPSSSSMQRGEARRDGSSWLEAKAPARQIAYLVAPTGMRLRPIRPDVPGIADARRPAFLSGSEIAGRRSAGGAQCAIGIELRCGLSVTGMCEHRHGGRDEQSP